jgi:ATP-binding cassette subfamily B protein
MSIAPASSSISAGDEAGGWRTLRRGFELSPALSAGLGVTILLAAVSTIGSSVIPVVIQQVLDHGLLAEGGVDRGRVWTYLALAAVVVLVTAVAGYAMKYRLFKASEAGLADLRVQAFRHVHDLPVLTQDTERRGALVSRVTSDVDQVSLFLQFSGLLIIISTGQLLVATVIMAVYSWQLTIVVWLCFAPLLVSLKVTQPRMTRAYARVRSSIGDMLSAISEPVVGASVVRAHAIADRTQQRIDAAIDTNLQANVRAQKLVAITFASAGVAGGLANAGVIVVGVLLGLAGNLTVGGVVAFAFLVSLFVGPVTTATQVITEAQNAVASWRRVIGVLDTPADVVDPGEAGTELPPGALSAHVEHVTYAYPEGAPVLHDVDVALAARTRVAVVGETGSGKTTFAKLLCRLMDPVEGRVLLSGVDVRDVSFASLRRRVVMVPQEGFLFDATLAENLRYGRPEADAQTLVQAFTDLGLRDWFEALPAGLDTEVGQRGESLSAGERQLVALVRAYLADPDLLVLDEATSAVDPQTELRISAALARLLEGRTAVIIAHRLSTAEQADEVLVFDRGRLVERGPHHELVTAGQVYGRLHASWVAQSHLPGTSGSAA